MPRPCRLHLLTKHRVFSGPGFLIAREVGDSAFGGQVVITHGAWMELKNHMERVCAIGYSQRYRAEVDGLGHQQIYLGKVYLWARGPTMSLNRQGKGNRGVLHSNLGALLDMSIFRKCLNAKSSALFDPHEHDAM